jgi:hypothetical protein
MHPEQPAHWNYSDDDALGPNGWPKHFGAGDSQSPINIIVDHCYLNACSSKTRPCESGRLHEQLGNKLAIGRAAARRDHLDSAGDDTNDSQYNELDNENQLNVHQERRSPSTSSNNSSVFSNDDAGQLVAAHSPSHRHHHHHHHHHPHLEHGSSNRLQNTRYCGTNKKVFLGYPRYLNSVRLSNTGHGWQIDIPPELAYHTRKFASCAG